MSSEVNKKNYFIEFLKQENKLSHTGNQEDIVVSTKQNPSINRNNSFRKFKWFAPKSSRDLGKVLEIKFPNAEENGFSTKENSIDLDDQQVDDWQQQLTNFKKSLPPSKKQEFNPQKSFINIFTQPFLNVPGILSYCREKEENQNRTPLVFKYLSLVIIAFILATLGTFLLPDETQTLTEFTSKILVESWYPNKKATTKTNFVYSPAVNSSRLADYIKNNSAKLSNLSNNKLFILLTKDDILGLTAGASNIANNDQEVKNNDSLVLVITNTTNTIVNSSSNLLNLLINKQKDFSIYLNNSLANFLSQ
ncbi:MAG: hypothetical protein NTW06_02490 [Candidatus Falkowbacteria bacterium]|nr:hypothetical protein [Candidatus Falkowbacteria bacterium]